MQAYFLESIKGSLGLVLYEHKPKKGFTMPNAEFIYFKNAPLKSISLTAIKNIILNRNPEYKNYYLKMVKGFVRI